MTKTTTPTPKDIKRNWYVLDASKQPLGRVASEAAKLLIGKEKPTFSYHFDNGNYVVIINAAKLQVTGNKLRDKKYYRHSGYMGNIKEVSLQSRVDSEPQKVILSAVKKMLPQNKLGNKLITRLKVFKHEEHPYTHLINQS